MSSATAPVSRARLIPMRPRDPHEPGRTASPLELFFDLVFVVAVSIAASELRPARRAGGRVSRMSTALEDLLVRHVETGTIVGAVALLGRGEDVEVAAIGAASDDGRPMRADAIMRIQSMTKVITSVAALRLVESGRLGLDQRVEEWLPELANRRVLSSPTAALQDTVPARRGWAGGSASGCTRRDRCGAGRAGPATRAPTSSSTRTGPSASCSPRWSWGNVRGRCSGSSRPFTSRPDLEGPSPAGASATRPTGPARRPELTAILTDPTRPNATGKQTETTSEGYSSQCSPIRPQPGLQ